MQLTLPLTARRVAVQPYPLALASIAIVGVVLRFWGLGAHFLSYDETFTALVARGSLEHLIAATAGDVHPPLAYIVVWGFIRLGTSAPAALRLPGALMSAAALPLVLALARRLNLSRAATLVGLALFALAPFQIHYAQDARMYPLLQLAVLGALVAAFDRQWWRLAACLTVAVWTHNYGLFYLAALAPLVVVRELELPVTVSDDAPGPVANPRAMLLALVVPVVLWLPWLAVLVGQMQTLSTGYWILPLTLAQALYPLYTLAWGVTLPSALAGIAALVIYGGFAFAVVKALRLRQMHVLVWLIVAPALLAAGVSLVWQPIYLFRAFIGAAAPLALLLGWAITERARWPLTAWAVGMLLPLMLLSLANRGPALRTMTGENSRALELVMVGWKAGDIVYHGNVGSLTGFLATAPAGMPNYLMPVQPGSVGVLTPQTRAALGLCEGPLSPGLVVADCGGVARSQSWRRVWLVWGASQTISGVEDAAIAALLDSYPHTQVLDIHDVYHGPMPVSGGIWLLTLPEGKEKAGVPK